MEKLPLKASLADILSLHKKIGEVKDYQVLGFKRGISRLFAEHKNI